MLTICIISFSLKNRITSLTSDLSLPEFIENIYVVIDDINIKRYSTEIYFHKPDGPFQNLKGIIYYTGDIRFNIGDHLFIHKKINKITISDKNQFNSYLISRGIHFTTGLTDRDITVLKTIEPSIRSTLQHYLLNRIDLLFKEPSAGVVKALFTGNQNYIEKKIIILFRDSGVLHVLSASGLHVAIFASIPAFLLIPFVRKNITTFISFIAVLFYLYITDMPVSLLRAVIMFGLFYFQTILFRNKNVFNCLMLTCSIILINSPWEIFSPGFQLSFAATAGILIFYKQYRRSLNSLPAIISNTTAVTLSAQIITLPIILFHMNQFNTAGIAANLIIIPLFTLIMGSALFAILISFFSLYTGFLFSNIAYLLIKLSFIITDFISGLRLNFYIYEITPLFLILLLISIIPLINSKKLMKLRYYPVFISAILCTLYLKNNHNNNDNSYIITNGTSKAEIRTENNKQVLNLILDEESNSQEFTTAIKIKNPDIKIIELVNNSSSGMIVSKLIMNDYIIDEYRFSKIPDLNNTFKKLIFQLKRDNIIVKFNDKRLNE